MEKEGKDPKKQKNTNYRLEALLGWALGDLVYIIVKVAKKERPTIRGIILSGIPGGIGTSLAAWGIPKLLEMDREAQRDYSFGQVAVPGYASMLAGTAPIQKVTPHMENPASSPPATQTAHEVKQTGPKQYTWLEILPPGSVTLILGKPGSGKTALGYYLLERLRYRTRCYVVSLPDTVHGDLPSWLGVVRSLEEAPIEAALLVDEVVLQFPARMSASEKNQKLLEVISLARQRSQIIIFIAQEASYIDINILRGLSTLIIKEPAPLQVPFERAELREFIQRAQEEFEKAEQDKRCWSYVAFSPCGYRGMVKTAKPDFFSDALSRCYAFPYQENSEKRAHTLSKEEKKKKAYEWCTKDRLSVREIAHRLGVSKSTVWNWIQEKKSKEGVDEYINRLLSELGQAREK